MSFFSLASQRMEWLSARQKVIAENVANADTPGFKARDVSSFQEMLSSTAVSSGVAVTTAGHISSSGPESAAPGVRVETDGSAWAASIDGNSVVLEQQTIRANEVSESYRLASSLYRKGYELLTLSVTGIR
mgnify:FL=1